MGLSDDLLIQKLGELHSSVASVQATVTDIQVEQAAIKGNVAAVQVTATQIQAEQATLKTHVDALRHKRLRWRSMAAAAVVIIGALAKWFPSFSAWLKHKG